MRRKRVDDETATEQFAGRPLAAALGAAEIMSVYPGDRLGWYRALASSWEVDAPSIERAWRNAADAGLDDRVSFHRADAADLGEARFGATFAFECVHDMPHRSRSWRRCDARWSSTAWSSSWTRPPASASKRRATPSNF
jgi:hypothetical protein